MYKPWLLQRMKKPAGNPISLAFGCGGSGIKPELQKKLESICSWDYMGAAEYEFGELARSLERIIKNKKKFKANVLNVFYNCRPFSWGEGLSENISGTNKVFYICLKKDIEELKGYLKEWAAKECLDTRDPLYFNESLAGEKANSHGIYGWIDIKNDYMFFTDEKMWRKFCDLLEIKVPSKKQISKK